MDMDKGEMRRRMRGRRRQVAPEVRTSASAGICARILGREDVRRAVAGGRTFAVYLASKHEIDLSVLIADLWRAGCTVAVPAWREGEYALVRYTPESRLVSGPMGIPEPDRDAALVPNAEVAVWIVPGLAFTSAGDRLGYGGGWYDRLLASAAPDAIRLGVAYPFQIVDGLPREPHDIALSGVVSASLAIPMAFLSFLLTR